MGDRLVKPQSVHTVELYVAKIKKKKNKESLKLIKSARQDIFIEWYKKNEKEINRMLIFV